MNEMDSKANTRAIDSLINYETVKYFGNESWEARRYDENLSRYEAAVVTSETSLGLLNTVQAAIIAMTVSLLMWRAADGIVNGALTLGDLVMVNALLIQLYIPLNFLGVLYREIKQSLTDMEKMFRLLSVNREIQDKPGAPALAVTRRRRSASRAWTSPTTAGARSSPASISRCRRERPSPWWARAARASPRWGGCSSASTTCSRGASPSTGRTSAT